MRALTYSRNVFIPVTDLCRNRCGYCSFRRGADNARIISRSEVLHLLSGGAEAGCTEALFSMGERPWDVAGFESLMAANVRSDFIDYLAELCDLALESGLLPHTNAGVLSEEDLARLAPYNASMGMMLETTAKVAAHRDSPGKRPDLRLSCIATAGRLKIPFTTGILVGIGEGWRDRLASFKAIADLHRSYDHIQEVIIQPFDPKPGTEMASSPSPNMIELSEVVRMARELLPDSVAIQVPPNLVDPLPLIESGANDLGGISPVTPDWINPSRPWPGLEDLRLRLAGYNFRERLPIYPRFILRGWCGYKTRKLVRSLSDQDGLRRNDYLRCSKVLVHEKEVA